MRDDRDDDYIDEEEDFPAGPGQLKPHQEPEFGDFEPEREDDLDLDEEEWRPEDEESGEDREDWLPEEDEPDWDAEAPGTARSVQDWSLDQESAELAPDDEEFDDRPGWPVGLIAVVVIALMLLAAGGYGIIQQRAATQEELRELRARLANAISTEQAADDREALRILREENGQLRGQLESLRRDNGRLADTVAGLESQLQTQVEAAETAVREAREQTVAEKPTSPAEEPAASGGDWFVNFSSYRDRAIAEAWRGKLQPSAGSVVVATAESGGRPLYRVRVVDLASREQAQAVARELEQEYQLEKLWVGRQ